MSQIAYQEALDPYHSLFRLLRIGRIVGTDRVLAIDTIRIFDFYLLFPFRIQGFRLKPEHRSYRAMSKRYEALKPYGDFPGDRAVFARMEPIQNASLATAARKGILDADAWERESAAFLAFALPAAFEQRIVSLNDDQADIAEFLRTLATDYTVMGKDGIKARSDFLEHRYDSVA
ncbi:MAG: ABC-three component system middle component 5 [Pseudomonadota bacterium]